MAFHPKILAFYFNFIRIDRRFSNSSLQFLCCIVVLSGEHPFSFLSLSSFYLFHFIATCVFISRHRLHFTLLVVFPSFHSLQIPRHFAILTFFSKNAHHLTLAHLALPRFHSTLRRNHEAISFSTFREIFRQTDHESCTMGDWRIEDEGHFFIIPHFLSFWNSNCLQFQMKFLTIMFIMKIIFTTKRDKDLTIFTYKSMISSRFHYSSFDIPYFMNRIRIASAFRYFVLQKK